MPHIRRTGVFLHTGKPPTKARTPISGGRNAKKADSGKLAELPAPKAARKNTSKRRHHKKPSLPRPMTGSANSLACNWCGSAPENTDAGSLPRCARCKQLESVISRAGSYLLQHGLRSLDASTLADSPEEAAHRTEAAEARRKLNSLWAKQRTAEKSRAQTKTKTSQTTAMPPNATRAQRRPTTQTKRASVPGQDQDDLEIVLRSVSELRARIVEEQRNGASTTDAGRARLADLQLQRRRLTRKATKIKAKRNQAGR